MTLTGSETRELKRRHLIYYLEVYDDATGEMIGHLVDVTPKGIKLVSKKEVMPDKNFTLGMMLPEEYFKERIIKIEARSMWCRKDVNPEFFATGFKTYNLDEEATAMINQLIEQVGFND